MRRVFRQDQRQATWAAFAHDPASPWLHVIVSRIARTPYCGARVYDERYASMQPERRDKKDCPAHLVRMQDNGLARWALCHGFFDSRVIAIVTLYRIRQSSALRHQFGVENLAGCGVVRLADRPGILCAHQPWSKDRQREDRGEEQTAEAHVEASLTDVVVLGHPTPGPAVADMRQTGYNGRSGPSGK